MQLTADLVILSLVINRLVELFKEALPPEDTSSRVDRWRTLLILVSSFLLGAAAVVFVFPTQNLFPGASSVLAGQMFTGVVIGGIANGWDFMGGLGESVVQRVQRNVTITASTPDQSRAAENVVQKLAA